MFQFASGFLSDLLQCFTDAAATLAYLNLLNWDHFLGWDLRRLRVGRLCIWFLWYLIMFLNPKLLVNFLLNIEIIKNKISIYFQILVFHFCASGNYSYLACKFLFETSQANIAFVIPKFIWNLLRMLRILKKKTFSVLWMMWIMTNDDNVILSQKFSHKRFAQFKLFFVEFLWKIIFYDRFYYFLLNYMKLKAL